MLKRVALALLLLSVLGMSCTSSATPIVGAPAPSFELFDLNNQAVRLSDYLGRPVIINFWGTNCGYCLEEMPILEAFFREEQAKTDGVALLAINMQDTLTTARAFMSYNNYTMPVLMDTGGRAASAYNVYAIPVTFLVDRTGIIRHIKLGMFSGLNELNAVLDTVR